MRVNLAEMQAAAVRVADRAEATLATEQAALAAEIKWAKANKQAVTGSYWKAAHVAGLKAQAARALAEALSPSAVAEAVAAVMEEENIR